jgi:hypothetical protein
MLHFELIHLPPRVGTHFFHVTLRVGHLNRATAQQGVSPIGYAGKPSLPCKAKAQTKNSGRNCWYKACYLLETGATLGRLKFNVIDARSELCVTAAQNGKLDKSFDPG